jgi:hypothetical protein
LAIAAIVTLAAGMAPANAGNPPGDVNGDNVVDVRDVATVNAAISQPSPPPADANTDGATNSVDSTFVLDIMRNGVPLTRVLGTSPVSGENGVAATREFVLQLSAPLPPAAAIPASRFFGRRGDQLLGANIVIGGASRRVTMYWTAEVPPESEITVTLDATNLLDKFGNAVDIDGDGQPGGIRRVVYRTQAEAVVQNSRVCGQVFGSEDAVSKNRVKLNRPLENAKVFLDGAEATVFDFTDAMGNFCLDPAPVDAFFARIDGSAVTGVTPVGAYFSTTGRQLVGRAGQTVGSEPIYLSKVLPTTLTPVDPMLPTTVVPPPEVIAQNPGVSGTSITVPPNGLVNDQGTPGGSVGIAPLPQDRIPTPTPGPTVSPVVVQVVTSGPSNFSQPATVCMPNTQNGARPPLAPGGKTGIWVYNADRGAWELSGSGTVIPSGAQMCSDPGFGLPVSGIVGTFEAVDTQGGAGGQLADAIGSEVPRKSGVLTRDSVVTAKGTSNGACAIEARDKGGRITCRASPPPDGTFDEYFRTAALANPQPGRLRAFLKRSGDAPATALRVGSAAAIISDRGAK